MDGKPAGMTANVPHGTIKFSRKEELCVAKIVAIANQKGGVGKTTTAVNLSSCVAALGKRVLIVDLDPQGNTTTGYGIPKRSVEKGTYEILIGEARASEAIRKTEYRTDVIGSNTRLAGASLEMIDLPARESRLRKALAEVQKDYDFIFIDCPPSLDLLTLNGLSACDRPYLVSSLQQNSESRLTKTDTNYYNYIWDNTLTYTDSWGSHNLNVLLGQSARQEQMRKLEGKATNVPGDYDEYLYLTQGNATGREVSDDGSCYRGLSYFARASYDYAGKYLLSLTMRADGSSKYQNKWGYFPSVGAAWVMSDEDFFKKQEVIDYMKVRASWGQLGNDHVSASDGFASIVTGTSASGVFGNTTLPGFQNTSYFSWLGWEKVEEFNVGVNFAVLDSRLNVDVDYYNRMTKNAVISTTLPFSTQTLAGNNGEIENSGVDIQLNWSDKIGKDFSYYAGVNLSTLRNRVKSLNGAPYIYGGSAESRTINLVGEEMQSYYGYKVLGVYQNQAQIDADPIAKANGLEPGDFIYEDINNDQVIDDKDRQILGSNIPRLTYSFNLGFQYKNLEFSLSTFGQAGNEIYNRKRAVRYTQANFNFDKDFYDNRWTGEGSTNTYPSAKGMLKAWNNSHTNSFFVEKGNFFRIQNIMLAYNFRNIRMGGYTLPGVKLSLTADRPFTYFTSNGFTPEISQNFGWDEGVYPLAATYTFGLTIDF